MSRVIHPPPKTFDLSSEFHDRLRGIWVIALHEFATRQFKTRDEERKRRAARAWWGHATWDCGGTGSIVSNVVRDRRVRSRVIEVNLG